MLKRILKGERTGGATNKQNYKEARKLKASETEFNMVWKTRAIR